MKAQEKFLDIVIYLIITLTISFFIVSCDKDIDGKGIITVAVKYEGKSTNQIKVSVKSKSYSDSQEINTYGETWFDNLPPDNYLVHAEIYDDSFKKYLKKDTTIKVVLRYRQNEYKVKLELK